VRVKVIIIRKEKREIRKEYVGNKKKTAGNFE